MARKFTVIARVVIREVEAETAFEAKDIVNELILETMLGEVTHLEAVKVSN